MPDATAVARLIDRALGAWDELCVAWSEAGARALSRSLQELSDKAGEAGQYGVGVAALEWARSLSEAAAIGLDPGLHRLCAKLKAASEEVCRRDSSAASAEGTPAGTHLVFLLREAELPAALAGLPAALAAESYRLREFQQLQLLGRALEEKNPDAILCDAALLRSLLDHLDADPRHALRRYPIVALSQQTGARAPGADLCLVRPSSKEVLAALDERVRALSREPARVLVVDDDLSQLVFCENVLRQHGMQVAVASSGGEALERITEFQPELMLVDLYMPGIDGLTFTQRVRERADSVLTPIVLLTGESDPQKRFDLLGLGGDDYLIKPVRPAHLVTAVQSRIQRAREIRRQMRAAAVAAPRERTGVPRAEFLSRCRELLARHQPGKQALAVLHLEIDQAASLRARLGLVAMSELEEAIGRQMARLLVRGDELCNLHDFRFLIAAARDDEGALRRLAEALLGQIREKPYLVGGRDEQLTASIGYAHVSAARGQIERWFQAAASAAAGAARAGGNRIEASIGAAEGAGGAQLARLRELLDRPPSRKHLWLGFEPLAQLRGAIAGQYRVHLRVPDEGSGQPFGQATVLGLARELGVQDRLEQFLSLQAVQVLTGQARSPRPLHLLLPVELRGRGTEALQDLSRFRHVWAGEARSLGFVFPADLVAADLKRYAELARVIHGLGARMALAQVAPSPRLPQVLDQIPADLCLLRPDLTLARDDRPVRELIELIAGFGREVAVEEVDDPARIEQLWRLGVHYACGEAIRAPGPEPDYGFRILGAIA